MTYYNYHGKIKSLIKDGHMTDFVHYDKWNNIENCYVFFFDNHKPMPIREYRLNEYLKFFEENNSDEFKRIDKPHNLI